MKLRSHSFQDLTNYEIESYLKENDVIFVPVGNAEMHGAYPVDCEYVMAEAWAKLFAEKCNALYMANNIYFAAGGTENGRGTVQMSLKDSAAYMYALSQSLLRQGFRRQVFIPSHGPTTLFLHPVIHQIFYDTKVPMLLLEPHHLFSAKGLVGPRRPARDGSHPVWHIKMFSDENGLGSHAQMFGAYKIVGRLNAIPTGDIANVPGTLIEEGMMTNNFFPDHDIINECSGVHCPAPFFYKDYFNHGSPAIPETREEIEKEAEAGEAEMRRLVNAVDFNIHLDVLRRLDKYTQEEVMPKHGDHLPANKWGI